MSRRSAVTPGDLPEEFVSLARQAADAGCPFELPGQAITAIPPRGGRPTWRVTYYAPFRRELSGGRTLGSLWAALDEAARRSRIATTPRADLPIRALVEQYLAHHAAVKWKERTVHDRRRDLNCLLGAGPDLNCADLPCSALTRVHLQAAVQRAGTAKRGAFLHKRLKHLMAWGMRQDYVHADQLAAVDRVEWLAPAGWKEPPSRRRMARRAGTDRHAVDRGDVPSHDQVRTFADEARVFYPHADGLIQVDAVTGLRLGELLPCTADPRVAERGLGNYIDPATWEIKVVVALGEEGGHDTGLPKADKVRDVVVPRTDCVPTGFDARGWLTKRGAEALAEQAAGTNPLALYWPAPKGSWWWQSNLNRRVFVPAAAAAGWQVTEVTDTNGRTRCYQRFTAHSLRDRYACTAIDEWGYTRSELFAQGSWEDMVTINRYYLGTDDATHGAVRNRIA